MACSTLKRQFSLEPLHSPRSENSKRSRHSNSAAGGGDPSGTVALLDKGVALSPSLTKDQVSTHIRHELKRLNKLRQTNNSDGLDAWKDRKSEGGDGSMEGYPNPYQNQDDNPIFTFGEVELICERMMKEREDKLREMYDQALKVKMAEQYDVFVKFTHDQIQKGAHVAAAYHSYLS